MAYGEAGDGRMLTARDVTNQSFTPTQFRHGYDERQVDDFLDQGVETLSYYEQGGRLGEQASASPARPDFTPTTGLAGTTSARSTTFSTRWSRPCATTRGGGRPVAQAPASSARTKSEDWDSGPPAGCAGTRRPDSTVRHRGVARPERSSAAGIRLAARGSGPEWCRPSP